MSAGTPKKRWLALLLILGLMTAILVVRRAGWFPSPGVEVVIINDDPWPIDRWRIFSSCGDLEVPRIEHGQSHRLWIFPRPGCWYNLSRGPGITSAIAEAQKTGGIVVVRQKLPDYFVVEVTCPGHL